MRKLLLLLVVALLLCTVACGDKEAGTTENTQILWENLTGLPDDFPKLCNSVTSTEEISSQNAVSIYWNLLKQDTFKSYLAKVEDWAGVKFTEAQIESGATVYTLETEKYKVEAAYNPKGTGNHIEAHLYDSQARITVISLL